LRRRGDISLNEVLRREDVERAWSGRHEGHQVRELPAAIGSSLISDVRADLTSEIVEGVLVLVITKSLEVAEANQHVEEAETVERLACGESA